MNDKKAFLIRAESAIQTPFLQIALDRNASRRQGAIADAFASIPDPTALRKRGKQIREEIIANLPQKVEHFAAQLEKNGFVVHRADTSAEAAQIVLDICKEKNAGLAAKSKSMVTEEIELNHVLERAGIRVVETDLGEYIVQLRDEKPSHIITPAVHLRREDVAETFVEKLGMEYSLDVSKMNDTARENLREVFLKADVGISGVNFGIVEQGTLCLLTNEGNGRMVTTVPDVHIAVMGMERLVNNWKDLSVLLKLLPRSATGQKITSYVSVISGPRRPEEWEGPQERHVVLVDNGRLDVQQSDFREILNCIRCGACINVCPVYQEIGGMSYGSVYPGPIGSVLSPALFGTQQYGHLAKASTLCGSCREICPVQIDLPGLLLKSRQEYIQQVQQPVLLMGMMKAYSLLMKSSAMYEFANRLGNIFMRLLPRQGGWVKQIPLIFKGWTSSRFFPAFAKQSFHHRMISGQVEQNVSMTEKVLPEAQKEIAPMERKPVDPVDLFITEVERLGGEVIRTTREEVHVEILRHLIQEGIQATAVSQELDSRYPELEVILNKSGIDCLPAMDTKETRAALEDSVEAGIDLAHSAVADTGSIFTSGSAQKSLLVSLLRRHISQSSRAELYILISRPGQRKMRPNCIRKAQVFV